MNTKSFDPAMYHLLAAASRAQEAGELTLARRLLLRAVRLDSSFLQAWQALSNIETGAQQAMCYRWIAHIEAMEATSHDKDNAFVRRLRQSRRWLFVPLAAGLVGIIWAGGSLPYYGHVVPGVVIEGVAVGGLTPPVASAKVNTELQARGRQGVTLKGAGQTWTIELHHLRKLDRQAVEVAYQVGHQDDWLTQASERWQHIFGETTTVSAIAPNTPLIGQLVEHVARKLDLEPLDAQLMLTPAGFGISPTRSGQMVDRVALHGQLEAVAIRDRVDAPLAVDVPLLEIAPRVTAEQLVAVRDQLNALQRQPLWVSVDGTQWPVDRVGLVDWGQGDGSIVVDEAALTQFIERLASAVDRAPQPSRLAWDGERVRGITMGVAGITVDRSEAIAQLRAALFEPARELALRTVTTAPPAGEAEALGLLAPIGQGDSQFLTYSSPERDANVWAGGQEIDGVLVPPGGEFSFTQTVRDLRWDEGYQMGEMIEAGQVIPALGGGICQVSTTLFRAALNSGLPIVERHSHSFRLPWYEVDSLPGMDATIVLGGPDLRFRNDTAGHILLLVSTDLQRKRQVITIYGTPTGRTIEVTPARSGGVGVVRRVLENGVPVRDETFQSRYVQ